MSLTQESNVDICTIFSKSWSSNCYIITAKDSNGNNRAAVIDPSASVDKIASLLADKDATLDLIILTHGHFDHVLNADELRDRSGAPLLIHESDAEMLGDGEKNAYSFFFGHDKVWRDADRLLHHGDELALGNEKIKVISTPGHSKGSICLLCDGFILTGDTIFADGFGRYDLWGGDVESLKRSIASLRELDRNITIYPGHGQSELLGHALDNVAYYMK